MRRVDHPRLITALARIEDSIDNAWRQFCADSGVRSGTPEEHDLAEVVLQDTSEFEWRVVDGALKQLTCSECGSGLAAGPVNCATCDLANGYRYAAREVDRAGVPAGNEHAIRVSSAVARTRHRYSARVRAGYELFLPDLLAGVLPTTPQAQRTRDLINRLTDDELERLITPADLTA
jgi:hypothetical protein